jgi:Amidase
MLIDEGAIVIGKTNIRKPFTIPASALNLLLPVGVRTCAELRQAACTRLQHTCGSSSNFAGVNAHSITACFALTCSSMSFCCAAAFSLSGTNANTSWAGVTYNAVNPLYAPGGSSAGTATAVAAGFSVWGIGAPWPPVAHLSPSD